MKFAVTVYVRGERADDSEPTWELRILSVDAMTEGEASEKAADFARNSEVEYLAGDGVGIRWRFVAIGQIQGFDPEELGDGSEILSMFLKNQEAVSMLASFDED